MWKVIGVALVGYNLYQNAHEQPTGTGTADDPIRLTTHSPLLALIGLVALLLED